MILDSPNNLEKVIIWVQRSACLLFIPSLFLLGEEGQQLKGILIFILGLIFILEAILVHSRHKFNNVLSFAIGVAFLILPWTMNMNLFTYLFGVFVIAIATYIVIQVKGRFKKGNSEA